MRVPRSWLEELVDDLGDTDELVGRLDGLGLSVEAVHELAAAPTGVVVAEVEAVRRLAGSDDLVVARVHDGERAIDVVCGAPIVAVGMRVALAPPGTRLDAAGRTVDVREVMGERSEGMLCSPRELGLYDHAGGLLVLGRDATPGTRLADVWPRETVLELEVTPNRADAFSVLGVARDLAAALGRPVRHPADAAAAHPGDAEVDDGLTIEVEDEARCPRFTLRRVDGLTVGPSPVWLQRRLAAVGLRPRNAVVDVTNFVTFELGQPSHAYDLRALAGGVMQVRRARAGERLVTLADDELTLDPADLVIATPGDGGSRAIGLAGVIGGRDESVRADTTSLALEVAHFEPVGVRRTARRHRLSTEAHYRFERGVDPNLPPVASARAASLIAEVAGGRVHRGVSARGGDVVRPAIAFRPERVAFLMDLDVPREEQRASLSALGCIVEERDAWRVTPPAWRFDLAIEEDLVEEVARLHGYERIGSTVPALTFVPSAGDPTHRTLRNALVGLGLLETIGYAFTGERELAASRAPAPRVRLSEPQGVERAVLRTALHPGLVAAARANRAAPALALFEIGHVFLEHERERLALLLSGRWLDAPWRDGVGVDFFVVKGLLEQLAEGLGARLEVRPAAAPHLHPGVSGEVLWNDRAVGTLGRLHPEVERSLELAETYVAELELPLEAAAPSLTAVARQPYAERDLAVVVPVALGYGELRLVAGAAAGRELDSLEPFDVYEGAQVGAGRKSLALRFRFRHADRALTDDEVDARMKDVIAALETEGYTIRT